LRAWTEATRGYKNGKRVWIPLYTVDEVRRHIIMLKQGGMSYASIGRAAGVNGTNTISRIASGSTKRVNVATAERILGVTLRDRDQNDRVPAEHARRLVRAISASDVPTRVVSEAMGYRHHRSIWALCCSRKTISKRSFDRLAFAYRMLANQGLVPASLLDEVGV
jgi:hypothetical protein